VSDKSVVVYSVKSCRAVEKTGLLFCTSHIYEMTDGYIVKL